MFNLKYKLGLMMSLLALSLPSFGQTTIAYQGFDFPVPANDWAFTSSVNSDTTSCLNASMTDIFGRVSSIQASSLATISPNGTDGGTLFWGARDVNGTCGITSTPSHSLSFGSQSVTGYTNLSLSFEYNIQGYDLADSVMYTLALDGVAQPQVTLFKKAISGDPSSTTDWDTLVINNINATSSVSLMLTVFQNGGNDYAGFDKFTLTGTQNSGPCTPTTATDVQTACGPFTWIDGNTYTTSNNTAVDTLVNAGGCDSIVTLDLTVGTATAATDLQTACTSLTWIDGNTYTSNNNTATFTLTNAAGCDSVVTLDLTITNSNYVNGVVLNDDFTDGNLTGNAVWSGDVNNFTVSAAKELQLNIQPNATTTSFIHTPAAIQDSTVWEFNVRMDFNPSTSNYADVYLQVDSADLSKNLSGYYLRFGGVGSTDSIGLFRVDTGVAQSVAFLYGANAAIASSPNVAVRVIRDNAGNWSLYTDYTGGSNLTLEHTASDATYNTGAYFGIFTKNSSTRSDKFFFDNISINKSTFAPINDTVSACGSLTWNGTTYSTTGVYTTTFTNAAGCDSVVTLDLTINTPSAPTTVTQAACGTFTWNGTTYTTTGMYMDTLANAAGCDSVVTLDLTINTASATTVTQTACGTFTWNGMTYSTTGMYMDTLANANGCDSIVTLDLTINATSATTVTQTACGTFTWNGTAYSTTGMYMDTLSGANGCDSIVTLDLTINSASATTVTQAACGTFTWNGTTYTTTGMYMDTLANAAGCDSIVTLDLTINTVSATVTNVNGTLTATPASATYTWIDCATNTAVANATMATFTPTVSGSYKVVVTKNTCVDTSACQQVTVVTTGLSTVANATVAIYPNPTTGAFFVDFGTELSAATIIVRTINGRIVATQNVENQASVALNITSASGLYIVEIQTAANRQLFKVVKQ